MKDLQRYRTDFSSFVGDFIGVNELGKPFQLMNHQRRILGMAFAFNQDGRLPWDTIIYSAPKKSGKTFVNALVTVWWAYTQEPPNKLLICANDLEQARGRVFRAIQKIIQNNPKLGRSVEIQSRQIQLSNGSLITALPTEYAGAAGSNHGLTSWDELWGYTSEASERLWEELTPVPTRKNSIRFITTYAGWENESKLLWNLYRLAVDQEEQAEGQGVRMRQDLPVFANRQARILCYWDHEQRMPWQAADYYETQRKNMRAGTFLRLHENRWATAESTFITPELWDPCVDLQHRPLPPMPRERSPVLFLGVDVGIKHDSSAVVGIYWNGETLCLGCHRIWKPSKSEPLDLEHTVEEYLREMYSRFRVGSIRVDPYQMHRSMSILKSARLPINEFPQTSGNTTRMGQTLFDLLKGRNIRLYPAPELRQQALSTVAIENQRGWRVAKEKTSKHIDAIVALAMASVVALEAVSRARSYGLTWGRDDGGGQGGFVTPSRLYPAPPVILK